MFSAAVFIRSIKKEDFVIKMATVDCYWILVESKGIISEGVLWTCIMFMPPFYNTSSVVVILAGRRSDNTLGLMSLWCDEAKISSEGQAGPLESFLLISFPFEY